jgi:hypothetical protein
MKPEDFFGPDEDTDDRQLQEDPGYAEWLDALIRESMHRIPELSPETLAAQNAWRAKWKA